MPLAQAGTVNPRKHPDIIAVNHPEIIGVKYFGTWSLAMSRDQVPQWGDAHLTVAGRDPHA